MDCRQAQVGRHLDVVVAYHRQVLGHAAPGLAGTFSFGTKTPPASYYLKKAAGVDKGSQTTGKTGAVGKVTVAQCREIAEAKMKDLNAIDLDGATKMIVGSARSIASPRRWSSC